MKEVVERRVSKLATELAKLSELTEAAKEKKAAKAQKAKEDTLAKFDLVVQKRMRCELFSSPFVFNFLDVSENGF